jgi:cardiolipin synthase
VESTLVIAAIIIVQLVIVFGFVMLERREPHATLAWILGVVMVPVIGVVVYLLFGLRRTVYRHKRAERVALRMRHVYHQWQVARKARGAGTARLPVRTRHLVELGVRTAGSYASPDNQVSVLINGGDTYRAIRDAIEAAVDHVHVQFYIIQPDESGEGLRAHLIAKARAGVTVRVLCDALGSMRLPKDFWDPLIAAGGRAAYYSPIRLAPMFRHRDHVNFRNHRKIVVVDGKVGLTGGINIGREYLGLDPTIGAWRDTHVRIEGAAVLTLQKTFVEDWLVSTEELLDNERYFPEPPATAPGTATVQALASGPDRPWAVIHHIHFLAVAQANHRVWLTTPYFVPDRVIQTALVTAALRGVDVRLLVPLRSDSRLVDWASRFYFPELLEAGVRIYQYDAGFLHAKTMVVDDWLAAIGSSNMDIRSFQLNYELTAFIYDEATTQSLADQYRTDLEQARELSPKWPRSLSYPRRVLYAFAGLLSPLL